MRASDFEFRYRFWIISALFFAAFGCYVFDHLTAAQRFARLIRQDSRFGVQLVLGVGALLALLAAWIRTWASAYLHSTVVKDADIHADRLVADGPYRHLRNPLYFGTLLLGISFGLMANPAGFFLLVGGLTIFVLRLIGREEVELEAIQGAAYRRYVRAVPALLPAFEPRVEASGTRPHWRQAFLGEAMMWIFAIGCTLFAITLIPWILYVFVAAGFIGYFPVRRVARRAS
ncbi:MAG TPA: methyltransferase [Gemmatimonadales bacterium]|nr:methyltransferase [Gemmatimonadales bacterium]